MDLNLSIIIVNWNTKDLLQGCLESIYQYLPDRQSFEVFVVDNASEDGSADMVRQNFSDVKLIANSDNLGFVAANNQASRLAKGKYLLIQNSDTVLRNGGLIEILKYMDEHEDVGIATGWMEYEDGDFQPPYRRFPSPFIVFLMQTIGRLKGKLVTGRSKLRCEDLDPKKILEVDWVTGAYLFLRRELLDDGDVFDRRIFMYFEDLLLCHRVKNLGYKVVYLPVGSIVHYCGKSAEQVRPKAVLYSFRSSVIYIERIKSVQTAKLYHKGARLIWRLLIVIMYPAQLLGREKARTKIDLFRFLLKEDKIK